MNIRSKKLASIITAAAMAAAMDIPSAAASPASSEVRQPFKESMATTILGIHFDIQTHKSSIFPPHAAQERAIYRIFAPT